MNRQRAQRQTIEEASPLEVYRRALKFADEDSVHDVIVRAGPEILRQGLPYVVAAARWQYMSGRRKEVRRKSLGESADAAYGTPPSLWDPYERVARHQVFRVIVDALSTLPDEDVLAVWGHVEGRSDEEIRANWIAWGVGPKNPTVELIRKRRQRALERVRAIIKSRLRDRP